MKRFLMTALVIAGIFTTALVYRPSSAPSSTPSSTPRGPSSTPVVPNPTGGNYSTPPAEQVAFYQQQVSDGQRMLRDLYAKIKSTQLQIAEAERDYSDALAQLKAKVAEVERLAYEAVQKYQLNPDQAFTVTQCDAGLIVCQKYLETYPSGEYAVAVRQQGVQLQQEKERVEKGLLKFGNRWMSASQKAAEQEEAARLQAERDRQALAEQQERARLRAERDRQALAEQEREAQHLRMRGQWGEGIEDYRYCTVVGILEHGLLVDMKWSKFEEGLSASDSRVVALVNHPMQQSLAEGDTFTCFARREGNVEGKNATGNLRRLPRWVYVSER